MAEKIVAVEGKIDINSGKSAEELKKVAQGFAETAKAATSMEADVNVALSKAGAGASNFSKKVNAELEDQKAYIETLQHKYQELVTKIGETPEGGTKKALILQAKETQAAIEEQIEIMHLLEAETVASNQKIEESHKETANVVKVSTSETKNELESYRQAVVEQKNVISELENQLKRAENAKKNMAPGKEWAEQINYINGLKKGLVEHKSELSRLEQEYQKFKTSQTSTGQETNTLRTQILNLKNSMAELRAENMQDSEKYREMEKELVRLQTAMSEVNKQTKALSSSKGMLQGVMSGVTGLTGAFTAASGAAALFRSKNEDLQKVMLRVQSLMSITMGLQQVQQALHRENAFRTVLVTNVQKAYATAVETLNTKLKINIALSKALVIGGIGAVVAGVILLGKKIKEAAKEQEKFNEEAVKAKTAHTKLAETIKRESQEYAKGKAEITNYRNALGSENVSRNEKLKIIKKLQDIIPGYNAQLSAEGNLIKENTKAVGAYIASLEKQALAKSAMQDIEDIYAKIYEERKKLASLEKGDAGVSIISQYDDGTLSAAWEKKTEQYYKDLANEMGEAAANAVKEADRKAYLEASKTAAKYSIKQLEAQLKTITDFVNQEGLFDLSGISGTKESQKLLDEYKKMVVKSAEDAEKALSDLNKMGIEKRVDLVEYEYNERILKAEQAIEKQKKAAKELGIEFDTSKLDMYLETLRKMREKEITKINSEELDKYLTKYAGYTQKRINLEKQYVDELEAMEELNKKAIADTGVPVVSQEVINNLKKAMTEALAKLDNTQLKGDNIIVRVFKDASEKSKKELKSLIAETNKFIDFLENGTFTTDNEWGITKEQFEYLAKTPEELEKIKNALKSLNKETEKFDSEIEFASKELKKFKEALQAKDFDKAAKSFMNFGNVVNNISRDITGFIFDITDSLKGLSPEMEKQVAGVEEALNHMSNLIESTMQSAMAGAMIGGPTGAAVGAGLGLIKGFVTNVINSVAQQRKEKQEAYENQLKSEMDYKKAILDLDLQSLEIQKQRTDSQAQYLSSLGDSLREQWIRVGDEIEAQREKLMWLAIPTGEKNDFTHMTKLFGKAWDNMSYEELSKEYAKIKDLDDATRAAIEYYLELLKQNGDLYNEMEENALDLLDTLRGFTFDELANSIKDMFSQGKTSAADFADSFEDLMRKAMLASIEADIYNEALKDWYEKFTEYGKDGYTKEEIEELRAEYIRIMKNQDEKIKAMEETMGISLTSSSASSAAAARGFAQASQDSIDELNGRFLAVQTHTYNMSRDVTLLRSISSEQLTYIKKISENTYKLHAMADDMITVRKGIDTITNIGVKML